MARVLQSMSASIIYILSLRAIPFPTLLVSIDLPQPPFPSHLGVEGKNDPSPSSCNTSQGTGTKHTWSIKSCTTKALAKIWGIFWSSLWHNCGISHLLQSFRCASDFCLLTHASSFSHWLTCLDCNNSLHNGEVFANTASLSVVAYGFREEWTDRGCYHLLIKGNLIAENTLCVEVGIYRTVLLQTPQTSNGGYNKLFKK